MSRVRHLVVVFAACGGGQATAPPDAGPEFTPGVALALHGVAPDCATKKDTAGEVRTCAGPRGTILITIGAQNRLRSIEIDLRSLIPAHAKVLLLPALQPLLREAGLTAFATEFDKLRTGDRTSVQINGARIEIVAGGTSKLAPEYSVDLSW